MEINFYDLYSSELESNYKEFYIHPKYMYLNSKGYNLRAEKIYTYDDDGLNIMDVVALADCILTANCGELSNGCNGDLNGDNGWNVIDIIALVNCILNENCT